MGIMISAAAQTDREEVVQCQDLFNDIRTVGQSSNWGTPFFKWRASVQNDPRYQWGEERQLVSVRRTLGQHVLYSANRNSEDAHVVDWVNEWRRAPLCVGRLHSNVRVGQVVIADQ